MDLLKKSDDIDRELDFGTELSNIHLEQIKGENKVFSVYSIEKDHQMLKIQNKDTNTQDVAKTKNLVKSKTVETLSGFDQAENRTSSLKKPKEVIDNSKLTLLQPSTKKARKQVSPSAKASKSEKAETKKPKKDKHQRRETKSEKNQKVTKLKKNFQEDQYIWDGWDT